MSTPTREEIEAGVMAAYQRAIGHRLLVNYAAVWTDDSNNEERRFNPPILVEVKPDTHEGCVVRWMSERNVDPYWDVQVIDSFGQLKPEERMYEVYGLGWCEEKGFETIFPEWEWDSPPLSYPFH